MFVYDFGDAYVSVLGEERGLRSYPIKTWMDLGLKPCDRQRRAGLRSESVPEFLHHADAQDRGRAR